MKIKILSGWSMPGGSTSHHIALTDLLNKNGYDCTFYGPHPWHLDKCKAGKIEDSDLCDDDILISHYINYNNLGTNKVNVKKHILSCHETDIFPLNKVNVGPYDVIQYVSEFQRNWHSINKPYVIIPPIVEKVKWKCPNNNTAGVIGSIDGHKCPHLSIERALADGYEKVLLYGNITGLPYYNEQVDKWVTEGKAVLVPHQNDRTAMYNTVCEVYHSSLRETYGLVEAECRLAGIPFNGESNNQDILSEEEILERWKTVLP